MHKYPNLKLANKPIASYYFSVVHFYSHTAARTEVRDRKPNGLRLQITLRTVSEIVPTETVLSKPISVWRYTLSHADTETGKLSNRTLRTSSRSDILPYLTPWLLRWYG